MKPLVTLVSPVYNAMPYLQAFLVCLEKQTWRPLEVILVVPQMILPGVCVKIKSVWKPLDCL